MAKLADVNMKCHLTASSRVYVGALPEDVEVDELHDLMKEFGTVRGIRINGKYGFVQFDNEASAQAAINHKRVTCRGRTLILKIAVYRNNNAGGDGDGGEREPRNLEPRPFRDRSPMMHPPRGNYGGDWGENRYGGRPGERGDPYMGEGYPRDVGPYRGLPNSVPEKNDCEIIVVSKALTQYAEFIEGRLKRLGLVVDLLFPNEDVPIGRVLGNISSRGCLYAILVMPQNLEHNSLTLNILHGLPQEHRNMPIDDSMELISHNWAEYQTSGRVAGRAALMGHLRRLAAGNTLTVLQYDTVLQYLKDARVRQVKLELGEQAVDNSNKTQVDLQQRIMSILDGGDTTASPAPQAAPVPPPVLSNPVQMALDSLLNKITSN